MKYQPAAGADGVIFARAALWMMGFTIPHAGARPSNGADEGWRNGIE